MVTLRRGWQPGPDPDLRSGRLGNPRISDLRIGDTPLGQFKGTSHHILRGQAGPERADIHTEAGATLENTDWHTRRTAQDSTHIAIDMTAILTSFDSKGGGHSSTAMVMIELRSVDGIPDITVSHTRSLTGDDRASQIRRSFIIRHPRPGTWEVRIRPAEPPRNEDRYIEQMNWLALRSMHITKPPGSPSRNDLFHAASISRRSKAHNRSRSH